MTFKLLKYNQILNLFFEDMIQYSKDRGFFSFAYQSRSHWMLRCIIDSKSQKGISFERICEEIPRILVSRSTIKNILDSGFNQKFFVKEQSKIDRRIQLYRLSKNNLTDVHKWVDRQKIIFNSFMT